MLRFHGLRCITVSNTTHWTAINYLMCPMNVISSKMHLVANSQEKGEISQISHAMKFWASELNSPKASKGL